MKKPAAVLIVVGLLTVAAGCINLPGDTSQIQLLSSTTQGGWQTDLYVNNAYPCAISGHQTFAIQHRVGTAPTTPAPLWVRMHGGGVGYWDTSTQPATFRPDTKMTAQEDLATLQSMAGSGLLTLVKNDPAGFRILLVSYCDRDVYGGTNAPDPGNPNPSITTNGLVATKAAIQFTEAGFATTKLFLQGTSAGSAGAYAVAWGLQTQGVPLAGIVADSGIINTEAKEAEVAQGLPCTTDGALNVGAVKARVDPLLGNVDNEPDKLVTRGDLTVPIAQLWNHGDPTQCGSTPMMCPVRNLPPGSPSTLPMGAADCENQPMHQAILNQGAASRSISLGLCVDASTPPGSCSTHVMTIRNRTSTDPPTDYNAAVLAWVDARLADG